MNDQIMPVEEIRHRCKLAIEYFTQPERLKKNLSRRRPPS